MHLAGQGLYPREGYTYVVDMDLEKFFDRVNHDILMSRLARHIKDKWVLKLIRAFLNAGMMENGVVHSREEGTPQGGPLSQLLANLLLDDLDKELEKRGHRFVRYADDCNIYVRSQRAGERVLESTSQYLSKKLKLRVNAKKSAVDLVSNRSFLGYRLFTDGSLGLPSQTITRFKDNVRQRTRRNKSIELPKMIDRVKNLVRGWSSYYRLLRSGSRLKQFDGWIRRKIRVVKLKQLKRNYTVWKFLVSKGVSHHDAWSQALSGKGYWRLSRTPQAHLSMNLAWFEEQDLDSLYGRMVSV